MPVDPRVLPFANARLAREISLKFQIDMHYLRLGKNIAREYLEHRESGVASAITVGQLQMRELLTQSSLRTAGILGAMQFNLLINQASMVSKGIAEDIAGDLATFIDTNALRSSILVESTDRQLASNIIARSIKDGESLAETADRLKNTFANISEKWRAERIARTEIGIVSSEAQDRGARKSGLDLLKEWVAVEDDRRRDTHKAADGQRVGMDEFFIVGNDKMLRPHDIINGTKKNYINCRCVTSYLVPELEVFAPVSVAS